MHLLAIDTVEPIDRIITVVFCVFLFVPPILLAVMPVYAHARRTAKGV
jgi:hypothetical protein